MFNQRGFELIRTGPSAFICCMLLSLAAVLLTASCNGSGAAGNLVRESAPGEGDAPASLETLLPGPLALLDQTGSPSGEERSVSFEPGGLLRKGDDYLDELPNNLVSRDASDAIFAPSWLPNDPLAELAYCMFLLDADGYNLDPLLRLTFAETEFAADSCFLGLANWDANRWQWLSVPADGIVNLSPSQMASYFNFSGDMLCAIVFTGDEEAILESIRLGDPLPTAVMTASPESGTVPLTVTLSAAGSSTPEGTITKHEWDYEGDGTFDFDSGMVAEIDHDYLVPGTYTPTLRVTNSFGETALEEDTVIVSGSWTHSSGLEATEEYNDIAFDVEGRIYAIGGTGNGSSNQELLLSAWAPDGELLWTRQWDSGYQSSDGLQVEVDSEGNVIVAGYVFIGLSDYRGLVQKWSAEGELIWSNEYNEAGHRTDFVGLATDLTDIYVTGSIAPTVGQADALTVKLGPTGVLQWQNRLNLGGHEYGIDLDLNRPEGSSENSLALVVQFFDTLFNLNSAMVGHLTMTGSSSGFTYITDTVNSYYAKNVLSTYNPQTEETELALSGLIAVGGTDRNFMLIHRPGMSFPILQVWSGADGTLVADMVLNEDGNYLVAGAAPAEMGALRDAAYWLYSSADGAILEASIWTGAQRPSVLRSVRPYYDGLLMAGGALDATGSWAELTGTVTNTSPILNSVSPPTVLVNVAGTALPGTIATPTMTLDSGAGASDAFIGLRLPQN